MPNIDKIRIKGVSYNITDSDAKKLISQLIQSKQNKLVAGSNITMVENEDGTVIISSSGGGSSSITIIINLSTNDGSDITSTVTLKNTVTGEVRETKEYNGETIIFSVPEEYAYTISFTSPEGYSKIKSVSGIASEPVIITRVFNNGKCYGFHVSSNEASATSAVTYIEEAEGLTPAYMNYNTGKFSYGSWANAFFMPKPCMLKYDGTVDYYLDPDDFSKKADGTDSDVSNIEYAGNAMIEWGSGGKIYYKIVANENDEATYDVYIADYKKDENFVCWSFINNQGEEVDTFYTPIYNGSLDSSNRMRSLSAKNIMMSKSGTQEISYARANNTTDDILWYTEVFADRTLIDLLLILISKSLDLQTSFGYGYASGGSQATNSAYLTGQMDKDGMFWGSSNNSTKGVKVFGMENYYGFEWRRTAGLMQSNGTYYYKLTYNKDDGSDVIGYPTSSVTGMLNGGSTPGNGYQKKNRAVGNILLPSETGGSSTTYYCDYFYINDSSTTYALFGGFSYGGARCGRYVDLYNGVGTATWYVGSALSCKPPKR